MIMATLAFILILSLLIIVHEFGHFIAARRAGVRVEQFALGFGVQLFKKKIGDTEYSLSLIPLGGYVKMAGDTYLECQGRSDEYFSKSPGKRFWIIFCGPFLNYILGFLFFWFILFAGYPTLTAKVGGLIDGYGAQAAGLQVADKIVEINGKPIVSWEDLQDQIQQNKTKSQLTLLLLRNGQKMEFNVAVKSKAVNNALGENKILGIIGITPFDEVIQLRHGLLESAYLGLKKTYDLTIMTYKGIWRLASGKMSMRDSMTGPLGIFFIASKAAKLGVIALLHLIAVLSTPSP